MGFITILASIIPNIVGIFADKLKGKRELEKAKVESKLRVNEAVTTANIDLAQAKQFADIKWEEAQVQAAGTSWKDEWFTVIISIPLVLVFVPFMVPHVLAGFEALEQTPEWYQLCVLIAIGSSFGVRVWDLVLRRKSKNNEGPE
jgi:uncharacterized membrane protein AbrB (regulator of aidB expression)